MFGSILQATNTIEGEFSIQSAMICTVISILLGLGIALIYMLQGGKSKNFSISVAILPLVIQAVIMMVNGNLGTGVAVAGAFSLVRVCMTVIIGVLLLVLSKTKFGEIEEKDKLLKVTIPKNLDYTDVFDDLSE